MVIRSYNMSIDKLENDSLEGLRKVYVDSVLAPPPDHTREIIEQYLDEKLMKTEAVEKLGSLKSKAEEYFTKLDMNFERIQY